KKFTIKLIKSQFIYQNITFLPILASAWAFLAHAEITCCRSFVLGNSYFKERCMAGQFISNKNEGLGAGATPEQGGTQPRRLPRLWQSGLEPGRNGREMPWGVIAGYGRWLARGFGGLSERGPASGKGRWAYHPPPWRRWLGVVAFVAGMTGMTMGAKSWAQMASAPFVFEGEVLRIETPGWESSSDYLVDASAYIDVAQGINAHI